MRAQILALLIAWISMNLFGCGLRRPFERAPGTTVQQQYDAAQHDPYADNDAGPEVVGGRPREFAKPRSEPVRSRTHPASSPSGGGWFGNWFGQ
jgi:hypothetical protein